MLYIGRLFFLFTDIFVVFQVLHWILNHMPEGSKKSNLSELVSDKSYKLSYLEYNWGTND
jgi:hypothetical protein